MKLPKEVGAILSNKYVLYVVAFLAITNVIGYLAVQDFTSLLFFVLIGYLTSYFSKNMTVVLLSALVLTNLLMSTRRVKIQEGMVGKKTLPDLTTDEGSEEDDSDGPKIAPKNAPKDAPKAASQETDAEMAGKPGSLNVEELSPDAVKLGIEQMGGKNFAEQQRMIKENLESIKPMLSTAKEMLDTLKGAKDMIGQFGGLSDMLPGM
jgi:hypothetical protein